MVTRRAPGDENAAPGARMARIEGGRPPGILIVEDEPDFAGSCDRFLRGLGYRTWVAATGREAMTIIAAEAPDLVIADLRLPGETNGLDVVRHVRQRTPRIPVIVWTAYGSYRTREAAIQAGAGEYLGKPFALNELRSAVARALGSAQAVGGSGAERS